MPGLRRKAEVLLRRGAEKNAFESRSAGLNPANTVVLFNQMTSTAKTGAARRATIDSMIGVLRRQGKSAKEAKKYLAHFLLGKAAGGPIRADAQREHLIETDPWLKIMYSQSKKFPLGRKNGKWLRELRKEQRYLARRALKWHLPGRLERGGKGSIEEILRRNYPALFSGMPILGSGLPKDTIARNIRLEGRRPKPEKK